MEAAENCAMECTEAGENCPMEGTEAAANCSMEGTEDCILDSNSQENALSLQGWSKHDKYELLKALKACDSDDPLKIHEFISYKSPQDIQTAINFYNKQAKKLKPKKSQEKSKPMSKSLSVPLSEWSKFLTEKYNLSELITDSANAVRLIAEFEDYPPTSVTDNIDFRKIYHIIANALEGKPLPEDKCVADILNKCIHDTALTSKTFLKSSNVKRILSELNFDNYEDTFPTQQTFDNEIACIRHLASQKCYNPLNIPEQSLKYQSYI